MHQSNPGEGSLCEALDVVLPAAELERLAQIDALLRVVAARDWMRQVPCELIMPWPASNVPMWPA